ncbi:MAG: hypothetical protein V4506_07280 [Bacteroidota bacterium]
MIRLLVYDYEGDYSDEFPPKTAITIEEYFKTKPNWKPSFDNTILMFDFLTNNINENMNNFGYLDSIISQFIEIEKRLLENKFAILRTDNDNSGSFFIFEPKEDKVFFSFLKDLPMPYESFYPQVPSPQFYQGNFNQQLELYNYIEQNRNALIPEIQPLYINEMLNVSFLKKDFLRSLYKEIKLVKESIKR